MDVNGGGFPPGFVPLSITDARGRSTPIINGGGFIPPSPSGGGGGGFIPPSPSGGGGGFIPPFPSGSRFIPPPPSGLERSSTPAPIYGNPITRERNRKREEAETAATPPRSQSPVGGGGGGADWSAPLAALHPPIFPVTGHQQPFQHPPPGAGGTWGGGGGSSTTTHSPVLGTRPFIPGQTSTAGSGRGPTSGPRNQDFSSPVVPTQPPPYPVVARGVYLVVLLVLSVAVLVVV
jgi:hypothetical protein